MRWPFGLRDGRDRAAAGSSRAPIFLMGCICGAFRCSKRCNGCCRSRERTSTRWCRWCWALLHGIWSRNGALRWGNPSSGDCPHARQGTRMKPMRAHASALLHWPDLAGPNSSKYGGQPLADAWRMWPPRFPGKGELPKMRCHFFPRKAKLPAGLRCQLSIEPSGACGACCTPCSNACTLASSAAWAVAMISA